MLNAKYNIIPTFWDICIGTNYANNDELGFTICLFVNSGMSDNYKI